MHALALLAGVLLALWAPASWSAPLGVALSCLGAVLLFTRWWRSGLFAVLGLVLALHCAGRVLDATFDCGERRLVGARIETIPAAVDGGWQFDAEVSAARPPLFAPLRMRLTSHAALAPHVGEHWQYLIQFPTPADGERGATQARNLLRDHISATAVIRESPLNQRLESAPFSIDTLRERVAQKIAERVADPSAAALLAALAVGASGEVSTGQWRIFNATGITHLVAISGMHVTFFAMLCMGAARWFWGRVPWLAGRCRRESFTAATGIVLAFAYALLSGFSVPAQRTAVMLAAFLLARICGRVTQPLWSVAVSLAAVLLYDPLAVLSAGFWLSFCAVACIVVIAGARLQPPGSLRAAVQVQWVVTAALLPITVMLFGTFSAIGPLVNAAAIPLFTFALVPPVLVATVFYLLPGTVAQFVGNQLVDLAAWAAATSWPYLTASADLAGALWNAHAGLAWLCLSVPAALLLLLPVTPVLRAASALLLLSAFLTHAPGPAPGELQVQMFDTGASRTVLLRTARHQLLSGTGESFGSAGRRFETRILPTLLRDGGGLDLWMLQKPDRDAMHALALGHARIPVHETLMSESQRAPPELSSCSAREWTWDGVQFSLDATSGGCWLRAQVGTHVLQLLPERPGAQAIPAESAEVWILPRRADDARRILTNVTASSLLLASLTASEWQSPAWQQLQEEQLARSARLVSTAQGSVLVRMTSRAPPELTQGGWWQPGIWSASRSAQCRR
jgi:competence protein ComEC